MEFPTLANNATKHLMPFCYDLFFSKAGVSVYLEC